MSETTSAEARLKSLIARRGRITFAEFMELALYDPDGGYYAGGPAIGAEGDYFTSPTAHPAFGALIAVQLHLMWELMDRPRRFCVVEMGVGTGLLSRDVTGFAAEAFEEFSRSLRYIELERFPPRGTLAPPERRLVVARGIPLRNVVGCFLSNELVDAFPVHRFRIEPSGLKEVYVTLDEAGRFAEVLDEPSTPRLARRLLALEAPLPEGSQGEVNLGIRPWMAEVSAALSSGFVITIDYGYEASELYSSGRRDGTLQAYFRHTQTAGLYDRIGRQDITAHVDFSLIATEGGSLGLTPLGDFNQADFLRSLGFDEMLARLRAMKLTQGERDANVMAMRELVKPEGLGGFRVLIQERATGTGSPDWLAPADLPEAATRVPLLRREHVPLMQGRYPHLAWEGEELWPFDAASEG